MLEPGTKTRYPGANEHQTAGPRPAVTDKNQVSLWTPASLRLSSISPTFAGAPPSSTRTLLSPPSRPSHVSYQGSHSVSKKWALEAVITEAPFCRTPKNGKDSFTVMSSHSYNEVAKRRSIAFDFLSAVRTAMIEEAVGLVAGISVEQVGDEKLAMNR